MFESPAFRSGDSFCHLGLCVPCSLGKSVFWQELEPCNAAQGPGSVKTAWLVFSCKSVPVSRGHQGSLAIENWLHFRVCLRVFMGVFFSVCV